MKRIVWLLVLVFLTNCGDQSKVNSKKNLHLFTTDTVNDPEQKKIIWNKDGAEMVLIPERVGITTKGTYNDLGEKVPAKTGVITKPFYMDTKEVTVGQFKKFLEESKHKVSDVRDGTVTMREYWPRLYEYSPTDEHPMIFVDGEDINAYCKWVGKSLPTEAQWRSAVGTYQYGHEYANTKGTSGADRWRYTAPVGSLKPNDYGLYDIFGNVNEATCSTFMWEDYEETAASILMNTPGKLMERVSQLGIGLSWENRRSLTEGLNRNMNFFVLSSPTCGFRCVIGYRP